MSSTSSSRPSSSSPTTRATSTPRRSCARFRASGATDHVDRIIGEGWNLLMFPEGTRSRGGEIGKLHSGAAVIAAQHGIDIVPIYVDGTHAAMPPGQNWPKRRPGRLFSRRHKVEVRFGAPIAPRTVEERKEVMDEVRAFWERKGR